VQQPGKCLAVAAIDDLECLQVIPADRQKAGLTLYARPLSPTVYLSPDRPSAQTPPSLPA
jgi:hypothetical protein